MFQFESLLYLFLLLIIPLVYFLEKKGKPGFFLRSHPFKLKSKVSGIFHLNTFIKYLCLVFIIIALANPRTGDKKTFYDSKGVNIVIAVDVSGSMRARDMDKSMSLSRLDVLKEIVSDFVKKREGDRIGLVVFGTHAFTLLPLTRDYKSLDFFIDKIEIGMAGQNTAIGDAIAVSAKRLRDIESTNNIIILATDGDSNSGELPPKPAAVKAGEENIKIYTIGIGSTGYAPFPTKDFFGREVLRKAMVSMDEELLKEISKITGGAYFNAKNREDLEKIYGNIDKLEKSTVKVESFETNNDYYLYFLVSALFLFLLSLFLTHTRLIEIP
ncbi:MAG: VWA domain-containing protein [Desulforegulaceae bacterium]|nr:VWA domain-containing protein [Desulforegulaceae bacterium]